MDSCESAHGAPNVNVDDDAACAAGAVGAAGAAGASNAASETASSGRRSSAQIRVRVQVLEVRPMGSTFVGVGLNPLEPKQKWIYERVECFHD